MGGMPGLHGIATSHSQMQFADGTAVGQEGFIGISFTVSQCISCTFIKLGYFMSHCNFCG